MGWHIGFIQFECFAECRMDFGRISLQWTVNMINDVKVGHIRRKIIRIFAKRFIKERGRLARLLTYGLGFVSVESQVLALIDVISGLEIRVERLRIDGTWIFEPGLLCGRDLDPYLAGDFIGNGALQ